MAKNKKFEPSIDILQNVVKELKSNILKPSDILVATRALMRTKYSINKKEKGKVELSKRNLDLLLDHTSTAYFADESGTRLPWTSDKRQEIVQIALRTGIAALVMAEEIGLDVKYIQNKMLEFIRALRDNVEIQHLAYPVNSGTGWGYFLDCEMSDYILALIVLVTSQEGLIPPKAMVPNVDDLYASEEQYELLKELELLLKLRIGPNPIFNPDNVENKIEGDNEMAKIEELNEEIANLKAALEEAKNAKPAKAEKAKTSWKQAVLYTAAGVAAGAAGMAAYNWLTDDTTTVSSRN